MVRNLSPKDLALVIGVSESSLKRWVDEGRLIATRTAGGHRRIALHEAIRFIRETNAVLSRPELLGIADLSGVPLTSISDGSGEHALLRALESGHAEQARGLMLAQYLTARSFATVCDGPIAFAMHRLGELWRHSETGIMVEHRATEIVLDTIHQIRSTLPPAPDNAPTAVGCAVAGDPYIMPALMASTVLVECGYREVNLGPNTPPDSLMQAVRQHNPKLVWIACSTTESPEAVRKQVDRIAAQVLPTGASLVLGGRGFLTATPSPIPSTHLVASMSEFASFARSLKAAPASVRTATADSPRVETVAPAPSAIAEPEPVMSTSHGLATSGGSANGRARPKR